MQNQKHLFQLPDDIHFLNCAYMSPMLKSVEEAGVQGMIRKRNPIGISPDDFFNGLIAIREKFAHIIHGKADQIAIIPSVSYGLSNVIKNLPLDNGTTALCVADEFPSDFYALEKWCVEHEKKLINISSPATTFPKAEKWNEKILDAITNETAVLVLSSVHWTDGTLFDLKKIGMRCRETDTLFIVDGTQSVGALPMNVTDFGIDALICAGYKWLLGPYSYGLAYYGERFNQGVPIEESWMNRSNANDFTQLTNYTDQYNPGAGRYNVGEASNFILAPMCDAALSQILEWGPENIQQYCKDLTRPLCDFLKENGFGIENENFRSAHLFGFTPPDHLNAALLTEKLRQNKIYVSMRGKSVRVAPHVYNTEKDIEAIRSALTGLI